MIGLVMALTSTAFAQDVEAQGASTTAAAPAAETSPAVATSTAATNPQAGYTAAAL